MVSQTRVTALYVVQNAVASCEAEGIGYEKKRAFAMFHLGIAVLFLPFSQIFSFLASRSRTAWDCSSNDRRCASPKAEHQCKTDSAQVG